MIKVLAIYLYPTHRGVFRGGHWANMQNCGMAPPFVTWAEGLSSEMVAKAFFWPKTGPKLFWVIWVKTFFFFWSSPNYGQESGLCFIHSGLHYSQIFWISWPPLLKILRTLLPTQYTLCDWSFSYLNPILTFATNLSRLIKRLFTWYKSGYFHKSRLRQICRSSGNQNLY